MGVWMHVIGAWRFWGQKKRYEMCDEESWWSWGSRDSAVPQSARAVVASIDAGNSVRDGEELDVARDPAVHAETAEKQRTLNHGDSRRTFERPARTKSRGAITRIGSCIAPRIKTGKPYLTGCPRVCNYR